LLVQNASVKDFIAGIAGALTNHAIKGDDAYYSHMYFSGKTVVLNILNVKQ